jgi:hypothetical protein
MTKREAEKLIESNLIFINKPVLYKDQIWILAALKPKQIGNNFILLAELKQSKSILNIVTVESAADFDTYFKFWRLIA